MIVADASVLVEFVLGGPRGRLVEALFLADGDRPQVPAIADVEVVQALRSMVRSGSLSSARAGAAIAIFADMPLSRHLVHPLLPRIWALRDNLTAYDATYVALAEAMDCPLVTFDRKIARAPGHRAEVVLPD